MSVADLFESGLHKNNKGHYRNLLSLALADGVMAPEEEKILFETGIRIGLSPAQLEEINAKPMHYPTHPPLAKAERILRFIHFTKMVYADGVIDEKELKLLKIFGIAIGFTSDQVDSYFAKIRESIDQQLSEDEIIEKLF